jgi:hypothetical protein
MRELDAAQAYFGPTEGKRLPIGIGFLAWVLSEQYGGSPPTEPAHLNTENIALQLLDTSLRANPCAMWLSFGSDLAAWSAVVRHRDSVVNTEGGRLKLFIMVGNLEEARHAVEDCGADVLVVQGSFRSALFATRELEWPS